MSKTIIKANQFSNFKQKACIKEDMGVSESRFEEGLEENAQKVTENIGRSFNQTISQLSTDMKQYVVQKIFTHTHVSRIILWWGLRFS